MRWRTILSAVVAVCVMFAGCGRQEGQDAPYAPPAPNLVTADIQAGIEKHIEEQVRRGGGYLKLPFRDQELRLRLVRVHTAYLSKLGPRLYFACVDLVDVKGDVYDVDFFLAGEPAAMQVTETIVHKLNGQPYYAWEQKSDGTWHRLPLEKAAEGHFGVIRERDEFQFFYRAELPRITATARLWLPLAATDQFQKVEVRSIKAPGKENILKEREHGNRVLFLELGPEDSGKTIEILYQVKRLEKAAYAAEAPDQGKYLKPERLVPVNENFRQIAEEVVKGKKGDLVRALPFDAGERVPAGAVLAVVLADAAPWVRVWLPESSYARVAPGSPAEVRIDGIERTLAGRVLDVSREPEFTPHYALTERDRVHLVYETRVQILDAPPTLRPGIPAEVRIPDPAALEGTAR